MALTPVQTIALVLVVFTLIKLVVVTFNRKAWLDRVAKPIYQSKVSGGVMLVLAGVILWYLLAEMSIVQIMAVIAFVAMLAGFGFVQFGREMMPFAEKVYRKPFNTGTWISILIWLALSLWALKEIL